MNVSILIPSRNGVEFLEWAYKSIRKNQGDHNVEILVLDDISDKDSTWEWCERIMLSDPYFKAFRNTDKERLGISGGFKFLSEYATGDIICHWHNDMFMVSGTLDVVEKYLFSPTVDGFLHPQRNIVACLTRIEPPIYGKGKEKIVWDDAPVELDQWDESKFLEFLPTATQMWGNKTTGGHFAPFFMFREEYMKLGGNDVITFPKQAREDSDFGFRLVLAGYKTIQLPTFVFHFASRGNRRSKHETNSFTDNPVWVQHNLKATRNFIRKWRTFNLHDEYLKPNRPTVYDVAAKIRNCTYNLLANLEPWFSRVEVDVPKEQVQHYVENESVNTSFDLEQRVCLSGYIGAYASPDMILYIDGNKFTGDDFFNIQNLSDIITESDVEPGMEYEIGNMRLKVNNKKTYEHELIVCQK